MLDATSTVGYTVAALAFGLLAHRIAPSRPFLAGGFLLASLPILLFASTRNIWAGYGAALLFGVFIAVPNSMIPWYLCAKAPRSLWGDIFARLSSASAVGGAIGLAFAFSWLLLAYHLLGIASTERYLFLVFGFSVLLASVGIWLAASGRVSSKQPGQSGATLPARPSRSSPAGVSRDVLGPSPRGAFRDLWVVSSSLTGLLYLGLGMSFTGLLLYLVWGLAMPGYMLLVFVLLFRVAAWVVSNPAGRMVGHFSPMRLHQLAGTWRLIGVIALIVLAMLPAGPWSFVLAALTFCLFGASGGALSIYGLAAATDMVPNRYQGAAIFLFNGVSNGGAALGALAAGLIVYYLGFPAVMTVSALLMGVALWVWHRY